MSLSGNSAEALLEHGARQACVRCGAAPVFSMLHEEGVMYANILVRNECHSRSSGRRARLERFRRELPDDATRLHRGHGESLATGSGLGDAATERAQRRNARSAREVAIDVDRPMAERRRHESHGHTYAGMDAAF